GGAPSVANEISIHYKSPEKNAVVKYFSLCLSSMATDNFYIVSNSVSIFFCNFYTAQCSAKFNGGIVGVIVIPKCDNLVALFHYVIDCCIVAAVGRGYNFAYHCLCKQM